MIGGMSRHTIIDRRVIAVGYGMLCHSLFVTGVSMMIWQMYSGMSGCFGMLDQPFATIANVLLLVQFPLAHSFLLTQPGRTVLARLAPAAIGRDMASTTYVMIASAQTLLLFSLWTPSGTIWWQAGGAARAVLTLLYSASWLLLGKAIIDAGLGLQTGFIGWLAVFGNRRPAYPPMPQTGLFRYSRQPIYLAFTLTVWTVPTWTPDQLTIAIILSAYCLAGPLLKERRFAVLFGKSFEDYRRLHSYFIPMWPAIRGNDLSIYGRFAPHWWDGTVRWLRTLQNLVPARLAHFDGLVDWRGKAILDLGCGGGFMSEAIAGRGGIVSGLDPAAEAIAIAQAHAASQGLNIAYRAGTGESLPYADESFDAVVCVDVLEHVTDLDRVLAEVHRVLKPGGLFLFDTVNRTLLARLVVVHAAEDVLRLLPRGTHDAHKFIRPAELLGRLEKLGFETAPPIGLGPRGLTRRLDIMFGTVPTRAIIYLSWARKT